MKTLPAYSWRAPAWTGADAYPRLHDEHDPLLFACAMAEEAAALVDARLAERPQDAAALEGHKAQLQHALAEARAYLASVVATWSGSGAPTTSPRTIYAMEDLVERPARAVFALLGAPGREVPRAAPGEPAQGSFRLHYGSLTTDPSLVRVLGEADDVLANGRGDDALRSAIRARRRRLCDWLERDSADQHRQEAHDAALGLRISMIGEPIRLAMSLGLDPPAGQTDRELAGWVLAELAGRTDAPARAAVARLTTLLSVPFESPTPPPSPVMPVSVHEDLEALERDIHRAHGISE